MKLYDISFKQVLDNQGNFVHLELWQGGQHITIKIQNSQFNSASSSANWDTLKVFIDKLAASVKEQST